MSRQIGKGWQTQKERIMKNIDADLLRKEIERLKGELMYGSCSALIQVETNCKNEAYNEILSCIDSLQQEQTDMGEVSDGYHTFNELYYYRMLYNAAFFNLLPKELVHKSKRHHTGEECFGGGWFVVMANLPTGQISNHYELKDWDLFKVPEKEFADEWDGHTPQEAAERLHKYLQQEQSEVDLEKEVKKYFQGLWPGTETAEQCNTDMYFTPLAILRMVDYFYELGRTKKEE